MTPDQRFARARRAGITWLIAAFAMLAAQIALRFVLGSDNPIDDLIRGSGIVCAVTAIAELGWARGYREGRAEPRPHDQELTTP